MEKELIALAKLARLEQAVATGTMKNGMQLLVYPMDGDAGIVALGYDREHSQNVRPEEVVRKRSANMALFGSWLPGMFTDGSFYLVQRVSHLEREGQIILPSSLLNAAQELLT